MLPVLTSANELDLDSLAPAVRPVEPRLAAKVAALARAVRHRVFVEA